MFQDVTLAMHSKGAKEYVQAAQNGAAVVPDRLPDQGQLVSHQ